MNIGQREIPCVDSKTDELRGKPVIRPVFRINQLSQIAR